MEVLILHLPKRSVETKGMVALLIVLVTVASLFTSSLEGVLSPLYRISLIALCSLLLTMSQLSGSRGSYVFYRLFYRRVIVASSLLQSGKLVKMNWIAVRGVPHSNNFWDVMFLFGINVQQRRNVKLVGCVQIAIPLQQSIPMTLLKFSMESVFILGSMLLKLFPIVGTPSFSLKPKLVVNQIPFELLASARVQGLHLHLILLVGWVQHSQRKSVLLLKAGCQLYQDYLDVLLWILNTEECSCRGGFLQNAWNWVPGIWKGGVPRQLQWRKAEKKRPYEFKEALSFILLAEWIRESAEEQFLYPFQSQIICESQSITNPMFALVCDCLADGGEVCYNEGEEEKEIQMGLSEVCEGETTFVKDPSAQVNFGTQSVSNLCSFLNISIIYKNWFAAPYSPPPLSFKWQNERERGVVLNQNGATVGEVLGDGVVLSFSSPSIVNSFYVCLRVSVEGETYPVADFGYSTAELTSISPLGMKKITMEESDNDGTWYCSSFDFQESPTRDDGVIRLFPINRAESYEEEEGNYTNNTTRGLCYTLGALYCLIGFICAITLVLHIRQALQQNKTVLSLPSFCATTFCILCIFRACFMFLYPTGTFETEPLSYFVVFEIPTFLLFSVLIFMIYSFKRLVYKKGFFPGNPAPILAIGWSLVWGLWIIVTIVYSEVILDENSGSSACEGRVEATHNGEEDTRKLAIAYQSVIIAVTFLLTAIFFYYTYLMYTKTKNRASDIKQFVIVVGGSFNVAYFVRSVLFLIVLAADFASSIYLFCTLFFTEVLMMIFLLIQFNIHYVRAIASVVSDKTSKTNSSQSNSRG